MCEKKFKDLPLLKQLLIITFSVILSFFIILISISIPYAKIINSEIQKLGESTLKGQADDNFVMLIDDNAKLLSIRLNSAMENFLNPITFAVEDAHRSDFPFVISPESSYYDWPTTLASPIVYDTKYNSLVSFTASSYNVFNKTPHDLHGFPLTLNDTIVRTSILDLIFITAFKNDKDTFISGFVADRSFGMIREYPGQSVQSVSSPVNTLISYDPRNEEWFIDAMQAYGSIIVSDPYYDPYIKSKVITISRSFKDPITCQILGVVGCDISLASLIDDLKNINFYDADKYIRQVEDGMIIVNDSRSSFTKISESRTMVSSEFSLTEKKYVIEMVVDNAKLYGPSQSLIDRLHSMNTRFDTLLGALIPIVFIVTLLSVFILVRRIILPINNLKKKSEMIVGNFGTSTSTNIYGDISKSMENKSAIREIAEIQEKFTSIVNSSSSSNSTSSTPSVPSTPSAPPPPYSEY